MARCLSITTYARPSPLVILKLSRLQELFITAKYVEKRFLPRSRALPGRPPEAALWDAVTAGDVRHAPGPKVASMFSSYSPFDAAVHMGLQ